MTGVRRDHRIILACERSRPEVTLALVALVLAVTPIGCGDEALDPGAVNPGDGEAKGPGDDGPAVGNLPPVLGAIGDRIVGVGQALVLELKAVDPEGDPLTFSLSGALPDGAKFQKEPALFQWTPQTLVAPVYLTFVVTDGAGVDRETIRIEVSAAGENHPPSLVAPSDVGATVGVEVALFLVATDPDGDPLTFAMSGDVPDGASLDPHKGLFRWTPAPGDAGSMNHLTLSVTDGELTDTAPWTLAVAGGDVAASPPELTLPDIVEAEVGQPVSFEVSAVDTDGQSVDVALDSGAPEGATYGGGVFVWTPTVVEAGLGILVTFSATAGGLTAYGVVEIYVETLGPSTPCTDDPGEPNEDLSQATPLEAGTVLASLCDTDTSPQDRDIYSVILAPGEGLEAVLSFDAAAGDLDLAVFSEASQPLALSTGVGSTETVNYGAVGSETVFVVVYGVGQSTFSSAYSLEVQIGEASQCVDDNLEPNDVHGDAASFPFFGDTLVLCPGDLDWYSLYLFCGETLTLTLDAQGQGDLDISLWDPAGETPALLASAATPVDPEVLTLASVPEEKSYLVSVSGWPVSSGTDSYTLKAAFDGACFEAGILENHSPEAAWVLGGTDGEETGQRLCCQDDWYILQGAAEATLLVDIMVEGGGSAGVTIHDSTGEDQLAASEPGPTGALVEVTGLSAASYLVQVHGAAGTDYGISWLVQ